MPALGRVGDGLVKTEGSLECSKSCTLAPSSHTRWIFWLRLICNFPHSYFTKGREQRNHLDPFSLKQEREYPQYWFGPNKSWEAPHPYLPVHAYAEFLWWQSSFGTSHLTLNSTKELNWVQKWSSGKLWENHPSILNMYARKSMCSSSSQPEHGNTSLPWSWNQTSNLNIKLGMLGRDSKARFFIQPHLSDIMAQTQTRQNTLVF